MMEVDLSSAPNFQLELVNFKGNNGESVVIDVFNLHWIWEALDRNKISTIRALRIVRFNDRPIGLKLAKDIVEWLEKSHSMLQLVQNNG